MISTLDRPAGQTDSKQLRILLVDDIQENLELLHDVLSEYGYATIGATNGAEALELLDTENIHLIVADAMMPKIDGFQLCKVVKRNPVHTKIPFVIYTGNYVDKEDEELAHSIGVDKYVVKYAGLGSLVDAVNELCRQRYGYQSEDSGEMHRPIDDAAFLEKHHAILIKKLEQKMAELEVYAETLAMKNRELEVSEARYRSLFENAGVAIFILDGNYSQVVDVNKRGLALLGYSKEELLAMESFPFVEGQGPGENMLLARDSSLGEAAIMTRDQQVVDVEVVAGPVEELNATRVMLFMHNITEEKRMRQHLQQVEKMTLMGRLAAGIAHEIRNPLAAITLNLQYIDQLHGPSAQGRDSLKAALEGAHRIEHVVDNTLHLARLTPVHRQEENINPIIDHALWFLKIPVQEKDIRIETHFMQNLPPILVDSKQIEQVMLNLLQNAIEASPQSGLISISTECIHGSKNGDPAQPPKVLVEILDSGDGIPEEIVQHVFEPFRTTKSGGTGLGLHISKYIMDRHNAELCIQPAAGKGTLVRLLFPIVEQAHGGNNVEG
jgi:PAS domain S-box-containing protein